MYKRFIALIATLIFLVPSLTQSAAILTAEDLAPANALATIEVQLNGKLQKFFSGLAEEPLKSMDDPRLKMLINKVLNGDRVFLSGAVETAPAVLVSMPITDSEWEILIKDLDEHEYDGVKLYNEGNNKTADSDFYIAKIDNFAVGGMMEAVHKAIDFAHGTSKDTLNSNDKYKDFTNSYFSPRVLGITLNIKQIGAVLKSAMQDDKEGQALADYLNLFEFEGGSLADTSTGYKFNVKIKGDAEGLAKKGISFNAGGNFIPKLYKSFSNAKPILYEESFDPKAKFAQVKKTINDLLKQSGEDETIDDLLAEIKKESGTDIEEIFNVFDKEFSFAVQYDQNSPLPYVTLLADASNNKESASKLRNDLTNSIKKLFKENKVPKKVYKITETNGFTKIYFDPTKADDYAGPPFPEFIFTLGVSEDGLFIVSNYPNIEETFKRTGFASNPDFASFLPELNQSLTGVFYLNTRNAWGFMDSFADWAQRAGAGEHGPPLDFYQGYYSILEKIYGWRDLFLTVNGSESEQLVTGSLTIDQAKHKTYEQLLSEIKSSDRDGDGISDYDEQYVYNTPMDSGDSDKDGVSDFDELMKGENPNGEGRLFKDVGENDYYTDEVAFLRQRGAISGYSDQTFQPGRFVNRAEFTTMVVKAFEQGTSDFLGVDMELRTAIKTMPFSDIDPYAWYAMPLAKAYGAGFISGNYDQKTGQLKFRPGDNITRAEAIAILNKASGALKKTRPLASCENSTFKDVPSDAWYCEAVNNAYSQGVTKGRSEGIFDPNGRLNRAEAAVMIRRTLEKDLAEMAAGTESFGEMAAPIAAPLAPIFGPIIAP
ncbi:S-layer homology domain-containing protein [Candidatus Peregrinibacteria bacterium]|nr:S-layer homology domain-containing protein [Candidatus Peregrinibacteria bacterium]